MIINGALRTLALCILLCHELYVHKWQQSRRSAQGGGAVRPNARAHMSGVRKGFSPVGKGTMTIHNKHGGKTRSPISLRVLPIKFISQNSSSSAYKTAYHVSHMREDHLPTRPEIINHCGIHQFRNCSLISTEASTPTFHPADEVCGRSLARRGRAEKWRGERSQADRVAPSVRLRRQTRNTTAPVMNRTHVSHAGAAHSCPRTPGTLYATHLAE